MSEPEESEKAGRQSGADDAPEVPEPTYEWADKTLQWDTRVRPGAHGLRLGDLNVGIYGEVPEHWEDQTRRPRGAVPRPGIPPLPYSLRAKHELWADSAAELYEEAIQRRWVPARDVPWETLEPLPEDVERAVCQICTELSQYASVELETITHWQEFMSYGYHEVKQYLATASFDATRHMEVFRKRALANGGGLGVEGRGEVNRMILESRGGWTEAALYLFLLRGTFTMTLYRHGLGWAHNEAERTIFARCIQDQARHLAYGLDHLRYARTHAPDEAAVLQTLLTVGEGVLIRELKDPVLREALAVVFAGGIDGAASVGMERYRHLMGDYMRYYLACCRWIGIPREERLPEPLAAYLEY